MDAIVKVLTWAHHLQLSCFGSPISINIDAGNGADTKKLIHVSTYAGNDMKHYIISDDMPTTDIYAEWGKLKDDVNKLRDQYIGHRVNKHGREIVKKV